MKAKLLHRRLSAGDQPKEWDATLEVFLLHLLGEVYAEKIGKTKPVLATKKAKGSHDILAKSQARDEIAREMLGLTADDKRVATRSKGLKKQVKCGMYLFDQLETIAAMRQGVSVLGLLAILPWEKMVKRCPGISSLAESSEQCFVWMRERVTRYDVITFILDLALAIEDYIRPGMVLDRLARRPTTPTDAGDSPAPSDAFEFQQRLNAVLTKHHLPPLTTWELPDDPMDAMRCMEGRHLGVVYWDRDLAFANPTDPKPHAKQFDTTDHLINLVAKVEVVISEANIYAALMAMTGPGCPHDMTAPHHRPNCTRRHNIQAIDCSHGGARECRQPQPHLLCGALYEHGRARGPRPDHQPARQGRARRQHHRALPVYPGPVHPSIRAKVHHDVPTLPCWKLQEDIGGGVQRGGDHAARHGYHNHRPHLQRRACREGDIQGNPEGRGPRLAMPPASLTGSHVG